MTLYRPKEVSEGINTSKKHSVADFTLLLVGSLIFLFVIYWFLGVVTHYLAKNISPKWEIENLSYVGSSLDSKKQKPSSIIYLSNLVQSLSKSMQPELGPDLKFIVHIEKSKEPNAFIMLGGRIIFTQGILNNFFKYENELAAVACHELGHFFHRHVIGGVGRRLLLQIFTAFISMESQSTLIVGGLQLTELAYSREKELEADKFAIDCLFKSYGHVGGYDQLHLKIKENHTEKTLLGKLQDSQWLAHMKTHPHSDERLKAMKEYAESQSYPLQGVMRDLPTVFFFE